MRDLKSPDSRFVDNFSAIDSIATSHGQNDSGMFELNFRDERYLPFEGQGAISTWQIDMPTDTNAFEFETISDVVINLNYTARDAGDTLRQKARDEVVGQTQSNVLRMFSLKRMKRHYENISVETMRALCEYDWPGNIRELQNLIERAVILCRGPVVRVPAGDLQPRAIPVPHSGHSGQPQTLNEAERAHILRTLKVSQRGRGPDDCQWDNMALHKPRDPSVEVVQIEQVDRNWLNTPTRCHLRGSAEHPRSPRW